MEITLGQQYNVGEKPTVLLYTYINSHAGTPEKQQKQQFKKKKNVVIHHQTNNYHTIRGQSLSWSAEQGKENKIKSLAAYPPTTTPDTARSEKNKIK